jgi:acyl-CoA oxidase
LSKGDKPEDIWNNNMMEMVAPSRTHSWNFVLRTFNDVATKAQSPDIRRALQKMALLYGLSLMERDFSLFLEHSYLHKEQTQMLRRLILDLCKELRRDAVGLVDAFDIPDFVLKAPLGRYDGNIYEAYFNRVCSAPGAIHVPPYFKTQIYPTTHAVPPQNQNAKL